MITRDQAYDRARRYILAQPTTVEIVVPEDDIRDEGWCWTVHYNSRAFFETGDINETLLGNGPVVVVKETGAMYETETAHPTEYHLDEIRQGRGVQVLDPPGPYRGFVYSREEAYEKARSYILAQPSTDEIVVPQEWVDNGGHCWVVYYNSRAFFETGDMKKLLRGTPPVEVVKETGAMYLLGGTSPEVYFGEWARHGRKPPPEFWWSER